MGLDSDLGKVGKMVALGLFPSLTASLCYTWLKNPGWAMTSLALPLSFPSWFNSGSPVTKCQCGPGPFIHVSFKSHNNAEGLLLSRLRLQ